MSVYCTQIGASSMNRFADGERIDIEATFCTDTPEDAMNLREALMDHEYISYVASHRDEIKEMTGTVRKLREL